MWTYTPSGQTSGNQQHYCFELHSTQPRKLQVQLQDCSYAENDVGILLLSGRVRPYGEDYPTEPDLAWLLLLLQQQPDHYYQRCAGFFAAVYLCKQSGDIRIFNDHVGAVPLYADWQQHDIWIGSSLRQAPRQQLSAQAIYHYFFYHCIPSELSVYQQVHKLPPGTELRLPLSGQAQQLLRYNPAYQYSHQSAAALQQQCRDLVEQAVQRNVSANAGAFLSGGLDSSTVSGYFARHQQNARTFSIGFDAKGYDETEYALITANHFQTQHQVHYLQPEEIVQNFVAVATAFEEPFGNSSAMAAYICASVAKQQGVDVMLAGDGGDEIFAGNERYAKQKTFELYQQVPKALKCPLEVLLHSALGKVPGFSKARSYIDQANVPLPDRLDSYNFLNRFNPTEMFCPEFLAQVDTGLPALAKQQRYQQCQSPDPVERMMFLDWKFTLADNDLVKVSTMCHQAGVEVRYPLFEKELVDFSCTVPADLKLPGKKLRDFYKQSFTGFLPQATIEKSKHGFGLPFGVWMKQQPALQQLTAQCLGRLKQRGIVKAEFIDQAMQTYQSGHAGYYGELIWIMVVLDLWLDSRGFDRLC